MLVPSSTADRRHHMNRFLERLATRDQDLRRYFVVSETARKELVDGAGTQFDPGVVRAMLQCGLEQPRSLELSGRLLELPGVARAASPGIAVPVAAAIASVAGLTVAPTHADSVPVTVAADVSSVAEAPPRSGTVPSTTANCDRVRGGDHEMAGADLSGCDLSGLTIDGIDLSDADLRDADLSDMAVTNFNLNGVNPRGADLRNAAFVDTPFGFAQVLRTNLSNGSFSGVNFNDADISESTFRDATRRRRRACGGAREPLVGRLFSRQFANPTASNTLPLGSSQSRRRWRGDGYAIADGLGLDGCSGSIRTGA